MQTYKFCHKVLLPHNVKILDAPLLSATPDVWFPNDHLGMP
jgi:hypothetical protein